jgi:hypothetical protein
MLLAQFWRVCGWSLFATLLVAAIGMAVPRVWVLNVDQQTWDLSWAVGSFAAGLALAVGWTALIARTKLDAAIELDRRFGLKERVSSTLALTPDELQSDIGRALVTDAVRRVERIDVREQFAVAPTWRLALPLLPAIALAGLAMLPTAAMKQAGATTTPTEEKKQIKTATQKLQQQLLQTQKRADEKALPDADLLKQVNGELNKTLNEALDRKDVLIKLNDIAKLVQERKEQLGDIDKMQKSLGKLKDLTKGPADRMAAALKDGDLGKAQDELKKLLGELRDGKFSKEDQEKLAKQLEQMSEKLEQANEVRRAVKEQLQQQIAQKLAEGNVGEAAKMQQQLDQMNQGAQQQQQMMQQMADKLGEAAQAMKEGGDPKQAAEKLEKVASELAQMKDQLDQLANLQEVLDQLADAKDAMSCPNCQGEGCAQCQSDGDGDGKGKGNKGKNKGKGKGEGAGQGEGLRDEQETDKSFYDTRVAADPKAGQSVRIGDAAGPNKAGKSVEAIKEEIRGSLTKEPDALEDVTLPRDQRDNAKQYFERLRKGQ